MKNSLMAAVVGFIFALGLGLSGMTQPQKIIGFLDIFGHWDPSLLFVMVGAISVHFVFLRFRAKRPRPEKTEITPSLVVGSLVFGVGWGLAGYCPGPAVVSLASFHSRPALFVVGMIVGMFIFKLVNRKVRFNR